MVARMHPMKDHDTFLRAAAIIHTRQPDVHFVIAGRGVCESEVLRQRITELGFSGCIHLLGEQRNVARLLAALDIMVSSSDSGEGFPNVVLEAMSCGTPCVVTDTGDSALVVADTGRIVPTKNPTALAEATLEVLELDSEERERLGRSARARVVNEFSLSAISKQYQDLYTQLIGLDAIARTSVPGR
jgi:glycosyltransferase involved in cell wall biosynthesis